MNMIVPFHLFLAFMASDLGLISATQESTSSDAGFATILNRARPVREGELWVLHDNMKEGDTLLKEQLKERYANLKEQLKDGDAHLKEQLADGMARLKEQLREGDAKLKEELSDDEEWLKNKLTKTEGRVKEQLAEGEARADEDRQQQRDALQKLRNFVDEWAKKHDAAMANLTEEMSDTRAQLQRTDVSLQATKTRLRTTQTELQAARDSLQTAQDAVQTMRNALQATQDDLKATRKDLEEETEASKAAKKQLDVAENEIRILKARADSLELIRPRTPQEMEETFFNPDVGSTFERWGRTECPDNTSLVYAGIVGGGFHDHTGGSSNHLCLVLNPQLDDMALPSAHTVIYGAEYEHVAGHHEQDVPCSVCRAPQATTLMVPATRTCPPGWTTQYTGYLMSGHHTHKHGTENVCMDGDMEDRHGGHVNNNGDLFYHVVTQCGSLPCPPYVNNKVVSCVVCSL